MTSRILSPGERPQEWNTIGDHQRRIQALEAHFASGGGGSGDRELIVVFNGVTVWLLASEQGDVFVDFDCTITSWTLLADQVGDIEIDIWKDTYANYPPTVGDSIVAAAPPSITADDHNQDSTLTGWTTAITAGDTLRFNINSVSGMFRCSLSLSLEPA